MAYHVRSDIETVFGSENVRRWADLNGNEDSAEITTRITWAIALSEDILNSMLRQGLYTVPIAAPIPALIVFLASTKSGLLLHDGRRITGNSDKDTVSMYRKQYEMLSHKIIRGQLRLDKTQLSKTYPFTWDDADEVVSL